MALSKKHTHQDKSTRVIEIDRDDVYLYKVVTWEDVLYHGCAFTEPEDDYIRAYAHNNLPMTPMMELEPSVWTIAAEKQ